MDWTPHAEEPFDYALNLENWQAGKAPHAVHAGEGKAGKAPHAVHAGEGKDGKDRRAE